MSAQNDMSAGPVRAVGALVRLTLADLLRTQRAILAGVVLLAPVAFTIYWSLAEHLTGVLVAGGYDVETIESEDDNLAAVFQYLTE